MRKRTWLTAKMQSGAKFCRQIEKQMEGCKRKRGVPVFEILGGFLLREFDVSAMSHFDHFSSARSS